MNRCHHPRSALHAFQRVYRRTLLLPACLALAATLVPLLPAQAQVISATASSTNNNTSTQAAEEFTVNVRQFPKNALRGALVVGVAPEITMDGKLDRLSPAVRIRDLNNNLVLSGTIAGQKLLVNYVRDNTGLVHQVWIINAEEAKQKMAGLPESGILTNIISAFDTPAVSDDGKTAYDKLPAYKP